MKNIILRDAPDGFTVALQTEDDIDTLWGEEGGLLEDAILSAQALSEELDADNKQAWMDVDVYGLSQTLTTEWESCLDYLWGYDPTYACDPTD